MVGLWRLCHRRCLSCSFRLRHAPGSMPVCTRDLHTSDPLLKKVIVTGSHGEDHVDTYALQILSSPRNRAVIAIAVSFDTLLDMLDVL